MAMNLVWVKGPLPETRPDKLYPSSKPAQPQVWVLPKPTLLDPIKINYICLSVFILFTYIKIKPKDILVKNDIPLYFEIILITPTLK